MVVVMEVGMVRKCILCSHRQNNFKIVYHPVQLTRYDL